MTEPDDQKSGTGGNHMLLYVFLEIQKYFNGPHSRSSWSNLEVRMALLTEVLGSAHVAQTRLF